MATTDIILWTVSITLAVTGILFGMIASYNSTKANRRIRELISSSLISEEAQKFFFDNIKIAIAENKKIANKFRKKDLTYYEYSTRAALGRLVPMSKKTKMLFDTSEFKELSAIYQMIKNVSDERFKEIVKDYSILSTEEIMEVEIIDSLRGYHKDVVDKLSQLLKQYNNIISGTKEIPTNKL